MYGRGKAADTRLHPRLVPGHCAQNQCRCPATGGQRTRSVAGQCFLQCLDRVLEPKSITHLYLRNNPIDTFSNNLSSLLDVLPTLRLSRRQWEQLDRTTTLDEDIHKADSLAEYRYQRVQDTYGFCMHDYRVECFWFEPVDLLRKLFLSGLLQFLHRGTAAQCFCGSAVAFASFGLQQSLRPYNEHESNVLKALVDTQPFLTFLISFILRVLHLEVDNGHGEPFSALFYGWLLVLSMVVLMVAAFVLTVAQMRRRQRCNASLPNEAGELSTSPSQPLVTFTTSNSSDPSATISTGRNDNVEQVSRGERKLIKLRQASARTADTADTFTIDASVETAVSMPDSFSTTARV